MNDDRQQPRRARDLADEAEELLTDDDDVDAARAARDSRLDSDLDDALDIVGALANVAVVMASNLDFQSLVDQVLDETLTAIDGRRGAIFIVNEADPGPILVSARLIDGEEMASIDELSRSVVARARAGEEVVSEDIADDPRLADIDSLKLKDIRSVVCLPLTLGDRCIGVLYVDHPAPRRFPRHVRIFLDAVARVAAVAIENARRHGDLVRENRSLRGRLVGVDGFGRLITSSPTMGAMLRRAELAARVELPVMVLGESGTGKELVARSVHESSSRATRRFVPYNCAAVPQALMESIFFGHMRGAFTGASRDAQGLFEQADGGILFLDEIADLDLALQAKLLRVLQDGLVRPVGGSDERPVDVRLVTATSRDLRARVHDGRFREDLFFRLNVLEIHVPPLRERIGDVPVLIRHFTDKHRQALGAKSFDIDDAAFEYLEQQTWTGNVRELENFVQRALVLVDGGRLTVEAASKILNPLNRKGQPPVDRRPAPGTIDDVERTNILDALRVTGGNKSKAARRLGIHRNSLARRMKRLGIEWTES